MDDGSYCSRTLYNSQWKEKKPTLDSRIPIHSLIESRQKEYLNHCQESIDPLRDGSADNNALAKDVH